MDKEAVLPSKCFYFFGGLFSHLCLSQNISFSHDYIMSSPLFFPDILDMLLFSAQIILSVVFF